jgi:SAM-dependent methyltransferase
MPTPLPLPQTDPTPIFEAFRGSYSTELLAVAVAHFDLFRRVAERPQTIDELRVDLGLAARPATVLVVAMRAMGLLAVDDAGRLGLTAIAREHLLPGGDFYVGDYVGLVADSPGVAEMARHLRTNRPADVPTDEQGGAGSQFTFREGTESAMDHESTARRLTLALAGRAKNVAPALARNYPLPDARALLDVGGGTGIYSIALVKANPRLRAIVWDRAEVLKVAGEFVHAAGVADRVELRAGDMFADPVPAGCDAVLLSNILHDWDVPECRALVRRCADALRAGGRLLVHDVFLNDALDGPLPVALYSAALFSVTEGRAYSAAEYRAFLTAAGLRPEPIVPTLVHCGVLPAVKR